MLSEEKRLSKEILETGQEMYDFAGRLFPIGRSLTGEGVRETLRLIQKQEPELESIMKI